MPPLTKFPLPNGLDDLKAVNSSIERPAATGRSRLFRQTQRSRRCSPAEPGGRVARAVAQERVELVLGADASVAASRSGYSDLSRPGRPACRGPLTPGNVTSSSPAGRLEQVIQFASPGQVAGLQVSRTMRVADSSARRRIFPPARAIRVWHPSIAAPVPRVTASQRRQAASRHFRLRQHLPAGSHSSGWTVGGVHHDQRGRSRSKTGGRAPTGPAGAAAANRGEGGSYPPARSPVILPPIRRPARAEMVGPPGAAVPA